MILIAPTAFKGTLSAAAVADAAARGARAVKASTVVRLPVSDGGPGLIDALEESTRSATVEMTVSGPLGRPTIARVLAGDGAAIIESADACGLHLISADERDPMAASTYGVGELLRRAVTERDSVIMGLGGSATIDAGLGLGEALGFRLLDGAGQPVERGGRGVLQLMRIEPGALQLPRVTGLADVRNPLYGPNGAARVFGPQKGASPEMIELLDAGLQRVAAIMQRDLGVVVGDMEGGGAAGGLAAGLRAFAGASLVSGSTWVLERIGFDRALAQAQVVVTGEGAYDAQSAMGKVTGEIIRRAGMVGVPVLLIAGSVSGELPRHVRAAGGGMLTLIDIERLVSEQLPRLLSPGA